MHLKLDDVLEKEIERAVRDGRNRDLPVIVTLKQSINHKELERRGLKIQHSIETISAVSGVINTTNINQLSQLEAVEMIEYDSEMQAL